MNPYALNKPDWHLPHADTREYVTVLHLHKSSPSTTSGLEYSYPEERGSKVNATKGKRTVLLNVR